MLPFFTMKGFDIFVRQWFLLHRRRIQVSLPCCRGRNSTRFTLLFDPKVFDFLVFLHLHFCARSEGLCKWKRIMENLLPSLWLPFLIPHAFIQSLAVIRDVNAPPEARENLIQTLLMQGIINRISPPPPSFHKGYFKEESHFGVFFFGCGGGMSILHHTSSLQDDTSLFLPLSPLLPLIFNFMTTLHFLDNGGDAELIYCICYSE